MRLKFIKFKCYSIFFTEALTVPLTEALTAVLTTVLAAVFAAVILPQILQQLLQYFLPLPRMQICFSTFQYLNGSETTMGCCLHAQGSSVNSLYLTVVESNNTVIFRCSQLLATKQESFPLWFSSGVFIDQNTPARARISPLFT